MQKAADAFRTISEVAEELDLPQHVLRFWETRFSQIKPMKRGGGRRYYRPDDINLLRGIRHLLYEEGYTIKGVKRILKEQGVRSVTDGMGEGADSAAAPVEPATGPATEVAQETPVNKSQQLEPKVGLVEPKVAAEASKAAPVSNNMTASAAGYDSPENLRPAPPQSAPTVEVPVKSQAASFSLTHNVPGHLVDAITENKSVMERAPALEANPEAMLAPTREQVSVQPTFEQPAAEAEQIAIEAEERPSDVLPEPVEEGGNRKARGGGLLKRFKSDAEEEVETAFEGGVGLSSDDTERLQHTLVDLLECKRLLDQIR